MSQHAPQPAHADGEFTVSGDLPLASRSSSAGDGRTAMRQRAGSPEGPHGTGSFPRSSAESIGGASQQAYAGRSPVLDVAQLEVLSRYGSEHDTAAGEVLFADGDLTYDLIVVLAGEARIIEGRGQAGETIIATYGHGQFLGEISLLTGQRAYLSAVASTAGRVLRVPVEQVRVVMAQELGLSELILRTFLLRHSILTGLGSGRRRRCGAGL